jgi:molybdopterin-binding protein
VEQFRIGQVAEMLGVSTDTVRRWVDMGELPAVRTGGGQRAIPGPALAEFAKAQAAAPSPPTIAEASARNRFVGIVTGVIKDKVMAQVEMVCGPHRVVSLMSREAADQLGLEQGVRAVASVKATNVVVEIPAS